MMSPPPLSPQPSIQRDTTLHHHLHHQHQLPLALVFLSSNTHSMLHDPCDVVQSLSCTPTDVPRPRLLRHPIRSVPPVVAQVLRRPSLLLPFAQALGRQILLRPSTGSNAPRVTCPGTGSSKKQKKKLFLSARSEVIRRASRMNGALVRRDPFFPAPFALPFPSFPLPYSCPCPSLWHPCCSLYSTVSLSCPARSDDQQNAGTFGHRSSGPRVVHAEFFFACSTCSRRFLISSSDLSQM